MKPMKIVQAFLDRFAYDFSSVQAQIPDSEAIKILTFGSMIPEDFLAGNGREDDIHVTVKYGIHTNDFTALRDLFVGVKPLKAKFGKVTLFDTNNDFDVVKVDIISPDLVKMNKKISQNFEVTDTHPKYHPHCTIAYVKKGCGKPFDGNDLFEGIKMELDEITFSGKNNRKTSFKLIK